jgi:hypothetical protein
LASSHCALRNNITIHESERVSQELSLGGRLEEKAPTGDDVFSGAAAGCEGPGEWGVEDEVCFGDGFGFEMAFVVEAELMGFERFQR